jgi:hypothetical protein
VTLRFEADPSFLVLSAPDKLEESSSLIALKAAIAAQLPRVDLPELLLEMHARTGFAGGLSHASALTHSADSQCGCEVRSYVDGTDSMRLVEPVGQKAT